MYLFRRSMIETLKTFIISIICSVIFSLMIYRESALPNSFVCFVLNLASLFLFLFIQHKVWSKLWIEAYTLSEYYIPALTSFAVHTLVSGLLYYNKFFLYMWLFLPTRFLEPKLMTGYDFVSYVAAQFIFFILIFITPKITLDRR